MKSVYNKICISQNIQFLLQINLSSLAKAMLTIISEKIKIFLWD